MGDAVVAPSRPRRAPVLRRRSSWVAFTLAFALTVGAVVPLASLFVGAVLLVAALSDLLRFVPDGLARRAGLPPAPRSTLERHVGQENLGFVLMMSVLLVVPGLMALAEGVWFTPPTAVAAAYLGGARDGAHGAWSAFRGLVDWETTTIEETRR